MSHHWTSGILANRQAWHGLGIVRPDGFSFLDPDVIEETDYIVRKVPLFLPDEIDPLQQIDTTRFALISDTVPGERGKTKVVGQSGGQYTVVQPSIVREYVHKLAAETGARPETCIVLRGGQNAVFCLDIGHTMILAEEVRTFLMIDSDYTGVNALGISASTIATVCANTQAAAQREHNIRIRHTAVVQQNLESALQAVGESIAHAKAYSERLLPLVRARLSSHDQTKALAKVAAIATGIHVFPDDPKARIAAERRVEKYAYRMVEYAAQAQNRTPEREGTAYGIAQVAFEALEYTGRKPRVRGSGLLKANSDETAETHEAILKHLEECFA